HAKTNDKTVHFLGLLSDGGVHSHTSHLRGLIEASERYGLKRTYIHAFTDGRDVDPKSGLGYVTQLNEFCADKNAKLASVIGRYYAMDRDKRWERVKMAYDLLVNGTGTRTKNPEASIRESYEAGVTDEFLLPLLITDGQDNPLSTIKNGDVVIFFNFR